MPEKEKPHKIGLRSRNGGTRKGSGRPRGQQQWEVIAYTVFEDGSETETTNITLSTAEMNGLAFGCGFLLVRSEEFIIHKTRGVADFIILAMANFLAGCLTGEKPPKMGVTYIKYRLLPSGRKTKSKIDEEASS